MTVPFGDQYSRYYDLIYHDKDYGKECDYIESLFAKYGKSKTNRILELGAGTGAYSIPLAERGYAVRATDISAPMLKIAGVKARGRRLAGSVSFEVADMRRIATGGPFDAVICMFAAIDYLPSLRDIGTACEAVYRLLRPEGLFIFDFWNGDAVLKQGPTQRFKVVRDAGTILIRLADPSLLPKTNSCSVHFTTFVIKGGKLKEEFMEDHKMRYLFRDEVKQVLTRSGFKLLSFHAFLSPEKTASDDDWNVTAVASRL